MAQDTEDGMPRLPFDEDEVARLMHLAREKRRGYADFWQWPPDKKMAEWHVARTVLKFLTAIGGGEVISLEPAERDPPDCVAVLRDGLRVGIEVTELVDAKMAKGHGARTAAERRGKPPNPEKAVAADEIAWWGAAELREAIVRAVATKDVLANGGPYDRYLVILHTDEDTITQSVLGDALAGPRIDTRHIDQAFVLLSYDPAADARFPDGCPVVEAPVLRVPPAGLVQR
jgi:hypothetical protein